ncbi:hypothetical protein ACTU45_33500 [Streptomyces sp. 24-1644]|uniref:hypothetical protein n=1 Tax=Streptomyces sp. 24-1644 TaxID=3457315 RepID=UPI003FA6F9CB
MPIPYDAIRRIWKDTANMSFLRLAKAAAVTTLAVIALGLSAPAGAAAPAGLDRPPVATVHDILWM